MCKRSRKLKVWERDKYICQYCGTRVSIKKIKRQTGLIPNMATVDHVTPQAKGGTDAHRNLITACSKCNNLLGDFYGTYEDKKKYITVILAKENKIQLTKNELNLDYYKTFENVQFAIANNKWESAKSLLSLLQEIDCLIDDRACLV